MTAAAYPHDVLCLGNALVDVLAHADDQFLAANGMAKGAMQLIDSERAVELYASMGPAVEISGGTAANTAAGIASFGGSPAFLGKVGADQLGEVFTHDIRAAGVAFSPPAPGPDTPPTGRCLIVVTPDAQRTMNTYLGAAIDIGPDDVDAAAVRAAKVLYLEGYLWDEPEAKAAMRKAMDVATDAGVTVALTLSDGFCVDRHRDEFLELIAGPVNLLFANEVETVALYESPSWEAAIERLRGQVEVACLTRGSAGSVVMSHHDEIHVAVQPVDRVVDTTGAGDLYAAGFLFGYTQGFDLEKSGRLGAVAASEIISHVGARSEVSLAELAAGAGLM